MNKILIKIFKNVQTFVSTITKKRETIPINIMKKAESFVFKLYTNMSIPFYNPKPYAFITVAIDNIGENEVWIKELTPLDGMTMSIDWGDGTVEQLTGVGNWLSHAYPETGEYIIKFKNPDRVKVFDIDPSASYGRITVNSKNLKACVNIEKLILYYMDYGEFNSAHLKHLRPSYFQLEYPTYGSGFITKFNSADVSEWRPDIFRLGSLGNFEGNQVTFNSSDVSLWNPTTFYLHFSEITSIYGSFNSSDVSLWNPSLFSISYTLGTFNSSDISSWNPDSFSFRFMKEGTLGTFNTSHISGWSLCTSFNFNDLPSSYTIIISDNSIRHMSGVSNFYVINNKLSQVQVDKILEEFYQGFANKTSNGGLIALGSTTSNIRENATPSGFYEASASPVYGQQYRYELKNDTQNINPTKKWMFIDIEEYNITMTGTLSGDNILTLGFFKVTGGSVAVSWGVFGANQIYSDGYEGYFSKDSFSGNTGNVIISNLDNIVEVNFKGMMSPSEVEFEFSNMEKFKNLESFVMESPSSGFYFALDTVYLSSLPIKNFEIKSSNFGGRTINTSDMTNWVITENFYLYLPIPGYPSGNINTLHMVSWNPVSFVLQQIPVSITGNINTLHMIGWSNITSFSIYVLPSTISGTLNSHQMLSWNNLESFTFVGVSGTFNGAINTSDFQNKPLSSFSLAQIPSGITGNMDSSYFESLSLVNVVMHSLHSGINGIINTIHFSSSTSLQIFEVFDNLGTTFVVTPDSFSGASDLFSLNVSNNSLTKANVDQILSDLWDAFPNRTTSYGMAYLDGNNSSPSGIYQPANPPTTGHEYAYELKYDTENVSSGQWGSIFLSLYEYDTLSGIDASTLATLDLQTLLETEIVE